MPLFTYVSTFEGASCVTQGRTSSFQGFPSAWTTALPKDALPGLTPILRRELAAKATASRFEPVANRDNVWTKAVEVGGREFRVYVVETRA